MSAQVAADLRAAADVLERDGWTQGAYHEVIDGRTCHCAEGAVDIAVGYYVGAGRYDTSFLTRTFLAYSAFEDEIGTTLISYNDTEGRTADEVIAALRAAADRAEADQ